MGQQPKPPASPSPPPCPPSDPDPGSGFDPIEEWLVDFDPAMLSELEAKGPELAEQAAVPHTLETAAQKSFDLEFGVKDQKVEVVSSELDGLLALDHLLVSGIDDLAMREDIPEKAVAMKMAATPPAAADTEMNATISVEVESEGGKEGQEAPATPADAEMMNTMVSVEVEAQGGKEGQESSDEESELESSEDDDELSSSEDSSSSEDEKEQGVNKDEESSEASSSEEEGREVRRHGGNW
jgi:H/ACA ribonucleoprotein complex non-core subunit NAF1